MKRRVMYNKLIKLRLIKARVMYIITIFFQKKLRIMLDNDVT